MEKMTTDDVLDWIAKKTADVALELNNPSQMFLHEARLGALGVMEELKHHILMKTNPHNREDIKRVNEKNG